MLLNHVAHGSVLDHGALASRDHPLLNGLTAWWLAVPGLMNSRRWFDLGPGRVHGTLTGMAASPTSTSGWGQTSRPGGFGELRFDGAGDYVALGTTFDVPTKPFTLCCWVYLRTAASFGTFFAKRNSFAAAQMRLQLGTDDTSRRILLTSVTTELATTTAAIPLTTWTHLGVVAVGSATNVYFNGKFQENIGSFTLGTLATAAVQLGSSEGAAVEDPLDGRLDDMMVFRRALSAPEIRALYQESRQGHPLLLTRLPLSPQGLAVVPGGLLAGSLALTGVGL